MFRQSLGKIRLLIIPFLLVIVSSLPAYAQEVIGPFHMYYVHAGEKHRLNVTSGIRLEVAQILDKVDHLSGLSNYQLPTKYILIQFEHPVVLSTFSAIRHPIQFLIITTPKYRGEQIHLLIKNGQGSWVEYHTTRALSIFIKQIPPSSIKDERGIY